MLGVVGLFTVFLKIGGVVWRTVDISTSIAIKTYFTISQFLYKKSVKKCG